MALMVPPTHPCPPFDNGLVRKGKATLAAEACAMVGSASAVEMIGLIGLVGGSGTVRAVRAIGAFDVVGTVKSVEAAELLELALTADTAFDPPPRRAAPLRVALLRFASLRFASLRFASLRFASLRFASLRFASLRFALHCHGYQPPVEGRGCVGWRDRCAAWMRLTSPPRMGLRRVPRTHTPPTRPRTSGADALQSQRKANKKPAAQAAGFRCRH